MDNGCPFCFASGGGGSRIQYAGAKLVESDAAAANCCYRVIAQIQPVGMAEMYVDDRLVLMTHWTFRPGRSPGPACGRGAKDISRTCGFTVAPGGRAEPYGELATRPAEFHGDPRELTLIGRRVS